MDQEHQDRVAQALAERRARAALESLALSTARCEVLLARSEPGCDPDAADRVLRRLDLQRIRLL